MAVRMAFYTSLSKKGIKELFIAQYDHLREQLLCSDLSALPVSPHGKAFLTRNKALPVLMSPIMADEIIYLFTRYTDMVEKNYKMHFPFVKSDIYSATYSAIKKCNDTTAIKLWEYLIFGRSLLDDNIDNNAPSLGFNPITQSEDLYTIGFWSVQEQRNLKSFLEKYFISSKKTADNESDNGASLVLQILEKAAQENREILFIES